MYLARCTAAVARRLAIQVRYRWYCSAGLGPGHVFLRQADADAVRAVPGVFPFPALAVRVTLYGLRTRAVNIIRRARVDSLWNFRVVRYYLSLFSYATCDRRRVAATDSSVARMALRWYVVVVQGKIPAWSVSKARRRGLLLRRLAATRTGRSRTSTLVEEATRTLASLNPYMKPAVPTARARSIWRLVQTAPIANLAMLHTLQQHRRCIRRRQVLRCNRCGCAEPRTPQPQQKPLPS